MNTRIKVIKRDERARQENAAEKPKHENPQGAARDMVATVTNWVNEFQQKRRAETTHAIKTLLAKPQTSRA